jgi:hypothetical protein
MRQSSSTSRKASKINITSPAPKNQGTRKKQTKKPSFVALAKFEIRKNEALASPVTVSITGKLPTTSWKRADIPYQLCDIPGIEDNKLKSVVQRKRIALKYIKDRFPPTL